ncbi:Leucine carboxyl methyltransferase 1 [Hypsizygus marmoreus]|uniref:Leucine carboxyl methyltransferase 1 n=1 Tax=Hypsizygus marmoreus TaxID=39966 RepID=A0A369JS65_HYPMA|nr:Leucine carboxyl methyltransferase 1 [Hypsizygus marmoreus]
MFPPRLTERDPDASIRETDTDAAVARFSAVQKGYVQDPFVRYFVPRPHLQHPRPPLINVGTYLRGTAIDELVDEWLVQSQSVGLQCQIVSMGAGSDTRFWRLATGKHKDTLARYIEIDFPEVTGKKAMAMRKSRDLNEVIGIGATDVRMSNGGIGVQTKYQLLPADLRQPPSTTFTKLLATPLWEGDSPLLSPSLPTLLLFECVLAYMEPTASDAILRWFVDYSSSGGSPLGAIVYEMFGLEDAFGKVMVNNLKSRNVSLPGAAPYPTVDSLPLRFLNTGFTAARALTLREIWKSYISPEELERISTLEMLDEVEELDLVLEHYAVTWGLLLPNPDAAAQSQWGGWGLKRKNPCT